MMVLVVGSGTDSDSREGKSFQTVDHLNGLHPASRPVHAKGVPLAESFSVGSSEASNKNTCIRRLLFPVAVFHPGPE